MYSLALLFMKFIIFSVIGYVVEMIYCMIIDKKITNRGFLCGPVIPIYGIGCVALSLVLKPVANNIVLVFLLGMILTSSIEYLTSFILEKIFNNKWWDYKEEKFNINGRICLKNSLLFGIASPIVLYILDPKITNFLLQMKDNVLMYITVFVFLIFVLDCIYSGIVAYQLRNHFIIVENLKNEKLAKIPGMLEQMLRKRSKGLKKYPQRLLKAFPNLIKKYQKEFEIMKKLSEKETKRERKSSKKK